MKLKGLYLLFLTSIVVSCNKGIGTPPPAQPDCDWTSKVDFFFAPEVLLNHPTADLPDYRNIYLGEDRGISGLNLVLDKSTSGSVKITTTATGCLGILSKVKLCTKVTNSAASPDVVGTSIRNVDYPKKSSSMPQVKLEIKSGPHYDMSGNVGYVVWTKSLGDYRQSQNGIFSGTFVATKMGSTKNSVYINGKNVEL